MKTIALFSSKGGVGRTSIAYHLGFMFAELGKHVVLADLDPQANLSAMCLTDDRLDAIWTRKPPPTIVGAIEQLHRGTGDIDPLEPERIMEKLVLVPGTWSSPRSMTTSLNNGRRASKAMSARFGSPQRCTAWSERLAVGLAQTRHTRPRSKFRSHQSRRAHCRGLRDRSGCA